MTQPVTQAPWIGRMLIDGQWHASARAEHIVNRNPAQADQVIGLYPRGTPADVWTVDLALFAARTRTLTWTGPRVRR